MFCTPNSSFCIDCLQLHICRPWRFWLVDQRCHGQSLGISGLPQPSSVKASAQDLGRLIDTSLAGVTIDAIIGHSLGGKVVLDLLQQRKDAPPSKQASYPNSMTYPNLLMLNAPDIRLSAKFVPWGMSQIAVRTLYLGLRLELCMHFNGQSPVHVISRGPEA